MKGYIVEYHEDPKLIEEEIEFLRHNKQWVADHPDETPEEYVADYPPTYMGHHTIHGVFLLSTEHPLDDGAVFSESREEIELWVKEVCENKGWEGTFEVISVEKEN